MGLVVLEGLDGSGKGTQAQLLHRALENRGEPVRKVTFPDYSSPSSSLVKMYLNGEFGSDPEDVNAYAASAFYAVDRYASYKKDWGADYRQGALILCDRYATSNLIYQLGKLPRTEWEGYLAWAQDLEYNKLGIPRQIWSSIWTCPWRSPKSSFCTATTGTAGRRTSMRATWPSCASAPRAPPSPPSAWAGRSSPAPETARPCLWRTSTRRCSAPWSPC